jgi:hypothetical protein
MFLGEKPQKVELRDMKPDIAKVGVEGSNPFARSNFSHDWKCERPHPGAVALALYPPMAAASGYQGQVG